ncbi:unnamed protein product [Lactuca virosa]|uniref:Uncharacterized protein n=1 Tax=Lactuca virosa TaxID=75947 RepID=A0AAU9NV32_9ASTR|nr:unnamed protein product [Lactuca virosa]
MMYMMTGKIGDKDNRSNSKMPKIDFHDHVSCELFAARDLYPTPLEVSSKDDVAVSRIRMRSFTNPDTFWWWSE